MFPRKLSGFGAAVEFLPPSLFACIRGPYSRTSAVISTFFALFLRLLFTGRKSDAPNQSQQHPDQLRSARNWRTSDPDPLFNCRPRLLCFPDSRLLETFHLCFNRPAWDRRDRQTRRRLFDRASR